MNQLEEKLRVVLVEPGQYARIAELEDTLAAKQAAVGGGLIDCAYPWEEKACIVANDEGLLNGMPLNRYVEDYQPIAGPFFVCGLSEEDFCGLTDEQAKRYQKMFLQPELFLKFKDGFTRVKYDDPRLPEAPKEAIEQIRQQNGLPGLCFAAPSTTDGIVMLRHGESGYYPLPLQPGYKSGSECADALNEKIGVSKAQKTAMLFGSLCGWDSPGADPARYDEDGKPILPKHPKKEKGER